MSVGDRSHLSARDLLRTGVVGLASRRTRSILSMVGIAIGIAALVAVLGISASSRADIMAQLDRLGTNLLTAGPGQSFLGEDTALPDDVGARVGRIGPVESVAEIATVDATVRRTDLISSSETGGIAVFATDPGLPASLGSTMRAGTFLNEATAATPTVVLGAVAAQRLGIERPGVLVHLGGVNHLVAGIMAANELAPDIDRAALIGFAQATALGGVGERPATTRLYIRSDPDRVEAVRSVLAATVDPANPEQVDVARPSDVLAARAATDSALTALFLGLGAVALLVGGIGIANVMVISVLERRGEIGLRRALGATRRHIGRQFLAEALILAAGGGLIGVALGSAVTAGYALSQDWSVSVPLVAMIGGVLAALLIGAGAGLYPALRAAKLAPTDALRSA